jgi:hypothetical protein
MKENRDIPQKTKVNETERTVSTSKMLSEQKLRHWLIRTEDDPECIGFVRAFTHHHAVVLAEQRMRLAGRTEAILVIEAPDMRAPSKSQAYKQKEPGDWKNRRAQKRKQEGGAL